MIENQDRPEREALIAFGANLGDRESTWQEAVSLLADRGVTILGVSQLVETKPVGGPDGQASFLNAALTVRTTDSPERLVSELLAIEREIGRVRARRWGPRLVDLDLMLYEQHVCDTVPCLVPHPRMTFRRFMLEPACEVAADWIHPLTQCSLGDLLQQLNDFDRRAELRLAAFDGESDREDVQTVVRTLEQMGWSVRDNREVKEREAEPAWRIVISDQRQPPAGMVAGPYLVLATSERSTWEAEIVAAVQAMSR
jgi:2-amino-4-hydroxy-6-hydroxymethyldihydropteridine diphosphokinase